MKRDECNDALRRRELRREGSQLDLAGLASVEVVADERQQPALLVTFVGAAPLELEPRHFRITGGRRPQPPEVVALRRGETIGGDDRVLLSLSGAHDHSLYTLHLARPAVGGRNRRPRVDPRHDHVEFVFDLACPPVDCASACECDELSPVQAAATIDYLAKDYASFRRLMLDRLALLLPSWTERHEADIGIMLVELLAHVGDQLSYHQDAVATEAYVGTARRRISIRRHARLVDYQLHEGCNARAFVCVGANLDIELDWAELSFATRAHDKSPSAEVFLPIVVDGSERLRVRTALASIEIYDWDGRLRGPQTSADEPTPELLDDRTCCLRRGSTSATLVLEPGLLAVGEFVVFEEVLGPRTGRPSDADPRHRHVVRLTRVERVVDPLEPRTPLVEIHWSAADALPFDLCLSTLTAPPDCRPLRQVSVARGNVVLVDHGRWQPLDELGVVPLADVQDRCDGPGRSCGEVRKAGRFRPVLDDGPITFSAPLPSSDPCLPGADALPSARALLEQDPRAALPMIEVFESDELGRSEPLAWTPRRDLLRSGPADRHFVAEIDDQGRAWLRFGDGELGAHPRACASMHARHRVGRGPQGNVGRDRITQLLTKQLLDGVELTVRNPLPAVGGVSPEPLERAREQLALPLRHDIQRALTAADYETIAEREIANLQSASAELLWNGSWYEAHVALDPRGHTGLDELTRCRTERVLERARRIGHDLYVGPARSVPLRIALHVCVAPTQLRAAVRTQLLSVLGRGRLRDGSLGYFHPDRLTFGEPVRLSPIVARVSQIPGVVAVRVERFERLFEGSHGELEQGYLPLARNEIARLDNNPVFPEHGILDIEVEGGR